MVFKSCRLPPYLKPKVSRNVLMYTSEDLYI